MASPYGGSEDDRDSCESEDEWTKLKSLVLGRISAIHSAGSFATFGCFENVVLPGIVVDEIGAIRLPLSPHDAQSLIRASRQAPFGKGGQTLVDETVRKTWEIDGSKVSFANQAWYGWLEGVVRTAAEDLGVAGGPTSVRAELYKMLLYEKNAMFKPHKDTEKTPGMFGTLVICLPSEHVGGAVRLTHGQEEKKFDTAKLSAFNTTYIAWYADITHEIEPIQSGYRWVLTYNLISNSSSSPQSAAGLDAQLARFCQTLAEWRSLSEGPKCLCYALGHQYTDAGLKLANLKGEDYHRARYVADACSKAGDFCVLLANMRKVVTFPNDEEGEENKLSDLQLTHIVNSEGHTLRKLLRIPEDFLLQRWLYESRDHDDQMGGEYLGNQHAEIDQFYNDSVILIVPKASTTNFLLGHKHNLGELQAFLQRLQEWFRTQNNDEHTRELIVQTCQNHLTPAYPNDKTKDLFLGPIAIAAISIADQGLFRNAVLSVTNGFNESTFFALGELICFQPPVVPEEDLVEAFSRIPELHRICRCLKAFRNGFATNNVNRSNESHVQYLASWIKDRISKDCKSLPEAYPQDAAALIEITKDYDDKMFEDFVKPFIAQFITDSSFSNAMAIEILSFSRSSSPDKDLVARLLPLVLDAAASQFDLQEYSSAAKGSSSREDYPYSSWPDCYQVEEKGRRDASIVVGLHQQLLQSNPKKASELLSQIQSQTGSLRYSDLDRLVIPLLEQMMYITDLCPLDAYQFYKSIMTTYITRVVQKEPEKPRDWARPDEKKKCYLSTCPDCQSLQEFLMDPREETRSFVLPENSWHLRSSVPGQCQATIDEAQKPSVLIVTKTLKGWEEEHSKWQVRATKAQEIFGRLPQTKLKQCLAEQYDAIMDLRMIKLQDEPSTAQSTDISEESTENRSDEQSESTRPRKRVRDDS